MKLRLATSFVAVLAVVAAVVFFFSGANFGFTPSSQDDAEAITLGGKVYAHNCAVCHGANGEGKAGWQTDSKLAPPHDATGHTWKHSDRSLFRFIKTGLIDDVCTIGAGGNMPVFKNVLSDRDIKALLAYISSRWPPQIRSLHEAVNRQYDAEDDKLTGG